MKEEKEECPICKGSYDENSDGMKCECPKDEPPALGINVSEKVGVLDEMK